MGGTTSKFDGNDWNLADGKLEDPSHTIDGVPPTADYQVFELQKKGVNQREFDVVDSAMNLMYTTRAVSGTLAWFDVLGPGSLGKHEDLRLRVHADLARRTWIVYRYNKPLFVGQKSALTVSSPKTDQSYHLYKTACITVSWSRYVAVAARYGPPPLSSSLSLDDTLTSKGDTRTGMSVDGTDSRNDSDTDDEDDMILQAAKIAARRRTESEADGELPTDEATATAAATTTTNNGSARNADNTVDPRSLSPAAKMLSGAFSTTCEMCTSPDQKSPPASEHDPDDITRMSVQKMDAAAQQTAAAPQQSATNDNTLIDTSTNTNESPLKAGESSGSKMRSFFMSKLTFQKNNDSNDADDVSSPSTPNEKVKKSGSRSRLYRQQSSQSEYETKLEGVINLDDDHMPIIKCQEIYNKIIGNHQTSLISKTEMIEMLKLDEAQHHKEKKEDGPASTSPVSPSRSAETDTETQDNPLVAAAIESDGDGRLVSTFDGRRIKSAWSSIKASLRGVDEMKTDSATKLDGIGETETENKDADGTPTEAEVVSTDKDEKGDDVAEAVEAKPVEQPLVAYWSWKNTVMVHKMQLHLAKNSDLALHVVLAIIVNQVRYERNAIAMTV